MLLELGLERVNANLFVRYNNVVVMLVVNYSASVVKYTFIGDGTDFHRLGLLYCPKLGGDRV